MAAGQKLFVVAGEPSGDLHAANLLRELQRIRPGLQPAGIGGPLMQAAGMTLHHDLASDAVMGLFPVVAALPRLRRVYRDAVRHLREQRPDALLLVDYPGFNLRLAEAAHGLGIPVIWYIAPKLWAWAPWRARRIARCVQRLLVILPFEEEWFRKAGLDAVHVGSPVVDHWHAHPEDPQQTLALRDGADICIGLFPGSRRHVVNSVLPDFLHAARLFRDALHTNGAARLRVLASLRPGSGEAHLERARAEGLDVRACPESALAVMHASDLSLAASGTVTLELALRGRPFVVGYRVSAPLWMAGKLLVKLHSVAPVNLVAGSRIVPEHVTVRASARALAEDLQRLHAAPQPMMEGLREVSRKLGAPGAAARAAAEVARFLDG